jgi:hypothetical protein
VLLVLLRSQRWRRVVGVLLRWYYRLLTVLWSVLRVLRMLLLVACWLRAWKCMMAPSLDLILLSLPLVLVLIVSVDEISASHEFESSEDDHVV